jgi:hypothetical protein
LQLIRERERAAFGITDEIRQLLGFTEFDHQQRQVPSREKISISSPQYSC